MKKSLPRTPSPRAQMTAQAADFEGFCHIHTQDRTELRSQHRLGLAVSAPDANCVTVDTPSVIGNDDNLACERAPILQPNVTSAPTNSGSAENSSEGLIAAMNTLLQQNALLMQQLTVSAGMRNYHILPDLPKTIKTFSGDETGPAAREWLESVKSAALLHN